MNETTPTPALRSAIAAALNKAGSSDSLGAYIPFTLAEIEHHVFEAVSPFLAPAPVALRSALWNHLHVEHGLTLLESELDEIIIKAQGVAQVAPAPVEQARGEATIREDVNALFELYDDDKIILAELACRVSAMLDKAESPHFQSLATEKGAPNWKDCAEYGWTIIANASGGNWDKETKDWQEAAARFRTQYYACLDAARASTGKGQT